VLCGLFLGAGLYVIPQHLRILQPYNAQQTAVFYLVDTIGMFLGVSFAVWIGVPRFGERGPRVSELSCSASPMPSLFSSGRI
jgi:hypothetical protein